MNRPNNVLIQKALTSFSENGKKLQGAFQDGLLTGTIDPELFERAQDIPRTKIQSLKQRIKRALKFRTHAVSLVEVESTTIENILELSGLTKLDILSLDVEGYEINALGGLSFKKIRPSIIIIEVRKRDLWDVVELLTYHGYSLTKNLSRFYFENLESWSGDHEDFLFIDNAVLLSNELVREQVFNYPVNGKRN